MIGGAMNVYHMWFNLRESHKDVEFSRHLAAYLDHLKSQSKIHSWRLTRRKFGFGPPTLAEFHCTVETTDLAQLDDAFSLVAARAGQTEDLHRKVYSAVKDFTAALYRDFPDPQRTA